MEIVLQAEPIEKARNADQAATAALLREARRLA
jgi:hypothetical protein